MPYHHAHDGKAADNIIHPLAASSFQGCLKTGYLDSFPCVPLLVGSVPLEDRSDSGMTLRPVTLRSATGMEPGESMPKSVTLGAPPSNTV